MLRYPILLADIGATVTRLALLEAPRAAVAVLARLPTSASKDFAAACAPVLAGIPGRPQSAFLAAAGRLARGCIRLTNAAWRLDPQEIGSALGLQSVVVVNDYVPVAALVGVSGAPGDCRFDGIGPTLPGEAGGARVVVGAGTGLGVAAALPCGRQTLLQTTEAGHMSFGACEPDEVAVWARLERAHGRITAESVLAAPGLLRLHRALATHSGSPGSASMPADVTAAAQAGDAGALETVRLHAALLGRFAGDMALSFGASGGVILGGGLPPRLLSTLRDGGFRTAFEAKAPFGDLMRSIPTAALGDPDPALAGLAKIARSPDDYVFAAGRFDA